MIILNSVEHAIALLDKRSNKYSDRPVLTMVSELAGWINTLVLTPYGERFREYRRLIARSIGGPNQMERHLPLLEHNARSFLRMILKDPEHVSGHIRK